MARCLGESYISWNHGIENDGPEHRTNVIRHLLGQTIATVIHGKRDTDDRERIVETRANSLHGLEQLA